MSQMNQGSDLSGLIHQCCFGCPEPLWGSTISGYNLLMFAIGAFIIVAVLLKFQESILKRHATTSLKEDSSALYHYKDILLQEKQGEYEYMPLTTKHKRLVQLLALILAIIVIATPLFELLNVEYFI